MKMVFMIVYIVANVNESVFFVYIKAYVNDIAFFVRLHKDLCK